ncbi:MAG: hypothetical protein L3K13_01830 [Thermoplasmata archaeon]|nr:hypothetical protein [Thermoplasmata archaeon]
MAKKPTWEDADLLLRIEELAANPQTRAALDWFERTARGPTEEPGRRVPKDAAEFAHVLRLLELFELVGTLTRSELLNEELVHHRWPSYLYWDFLKPTFERERKSLSPVLGENFEWLAERCRRTVPKSSSRR